MRIKGLPRFMLLAKTHAHELNFKNEDSPPMRAEIEAVTQDLKQSLELLRRHL